MHKESTMNVLKLIFSIVIGGLRIDQKGHFLAVIVFDDDLRRVSLFELLDHTRYLLEALSRKLGEGERGGKDKDK